MDKATLAEYLTLIGFDNQEVTKILDLKVNDSFTNSPIKELARDLREKLDFSAIERIEILREATGAYTVFQQVEKVSRVLLNAEKQRDGSYASKLPDGGKFYYSRGLAEVEAMLTELLLPEHIVNSIYSPISKKANKNDIKYATVGRNQLLKGDVRSEIYGDDMGQALKEANRMEKTNARYVMALAESLHSSDSKRKVSFEFVFSKTNRLEISNILEARALLDLSLIHI